MPVIANLIAQKDIKRADNAQRISDAFVFIV
jgi:hypothetical protein